LQAAWDTLHTLLADSRSLGAQPGILAALHTWSQPLVLPPPRHGLVPGGGRTPAGTGGAVRPGFLLPMRVVRSYGLYQHAHTAALAHGRAALGQPPGDPPLDLAWQTVCAQRGDAPPEQCPTCGPLRVCTSVIPRGGAPPPVLAQECAA
jgi:hypothetical protein